MLSETIRGLALASIMVFVSACTSSAGDAAGPDAGTTSDAGTGPSSDAGTVPGSAFFARMAGLWSGEAAQTPLGTFAEMNMDFRALDGTTLFGRVDLDPTDSLRYGFAYEEVDGVTTLVYRNGGYFQGIERDLTIPLVDSNDATGTYHFCAGSVCCMYVNSACVAETGGCNFVDATFTFTSPTELTFNALVQGKEHVLWTTQRKETRSLPSPFPATDSPQAADGGWPTMPQLSVTVSWSKPLTATTSIWVILSDVACFPNWTEGDLTPSCTPSRSLSTPAPAGATSATLLFDQIHPGTYYANSVVDTAGSFATTLSPAPGEAASIPDQSVNVPAAGQGTLTLSDAFAIP